MGDSHRNVSNCCAPSRGPGPVAIEVLHAGGGRNVVHEDVLIPESKFHMGDPFGEGYASDGETPVHEVHVAPFRIDATAVTNLMFAAFVDATDYRTEAEQYGTSAVFHMLVNAQQVDVLGSVGGAPWWLNVLGADWAHPAGRGSRWEQVPDHPVVHVSWNDAQSYCTWAGRRLPTEAEWECAARGGLVGKRYAWGDELMPGGEHYCNIWQGSFPLTNEAADGYGGTAPVKSFPANGYGLYEVAGNVWEWCADWFAPRYYQNGPSDNPQGPAIGTGRVMRGGSYLCHYSYCSRYRVAARTSNTPESSSGNCGFRTIALGTTDVSLAEGDGGKLEE